MKLLMQEKQIKWKQTDSFNAISSLISLSHGGFMFIDIDYNI